MPEEVRSALLHLRAVGPSSLASHELRKLTTVDAQHTTGVLCSQPSRADPRADRSRGNVCQTRSLGDGQVAIVRPQGAHVPSGEGRELLAQHLADCLPYELA
jgi:hypothetical protein